MFSISHLANKGDKLSV
uniref:Uncharacterized protein n=1 Tax=Arundo donax TaxID=35708 RepID=A0A0A9EQU7_ARUDO